MGVEAASPPAMRLSGCRPHGPAPLKKGRCQLLTGVTSQLPGWCVSRPLITAESLLFDCKRPWCQMKVLRWRGQFYSVCASSKRPNPRAPTPVHAIRQGQMRREMLATPFMAWNSGTNCLSVKCQSGKTAKGCGRSHSHHPPPLSWEHLKDWRHMFHFNSIIQFFQTCYFFPQHVQFHLTSFLKVKWVKFGDFTNKQRHPVVTFHDADELSLSLVCPNLIFVRWPSVTWQTPLNQCGIFTSMILTFYIAALFDSPSMSWACQSSSLQHSP